jgi:hypothetical protein
MNIIDYATTQSVYCTIHESKGNCNVIFECTQCKSLHRLVLKYRWDWNLTNLEQNDCDRDDSEISPNGAMFEIFVWEETINHNLQHIATAVNDFGYILSVVSIPLHQSDRRNSRTFSARGVELPILVIRVVRVSRSGYWSSVCTSLNHGLKCQRVQIYTRIFILNA